MSTRFLLPVLCLLISQVVEAAGLIRITADSTYSQRDTFITVTVEADAGLSGVKAMQLDIDVNPAVIQADTAYVTLGTLFSADPDSTFFFRYWLLSGSRLTLDIAVLGDALTRSGPGSIAHIRFRTVGFGESDISIASFKVRDSANQPLAVLTADGWAKVCRFAGDWDADNRIDISDLQAMIDYLFYGLPGPIPPYEAGDLDCSGLIDVSDLQALIDYLFLNNNYICNRCI